MSYESKIAEKIQDNWAELYDFSANGQHWYYTSYSGNVSFVGHEYEAIRLKRSEWSLSTELAPAQVKITVGLSAEMLAFLTSNSVPASDLTITRVFVDSLSDYYVIFQGALTSAVFAKDGAELTYESASILYVSKVPRFIYQAYCNHTLFNDKCGLEESAYKQTFDNVTISGNTITHASISVAGALWWQWGTAIYEGQYRMVTNQVGNTIYLHLPFADAATGCSIDLLPGCDKSPATCRTKFNNRTHGMFMPYIPCKNPTIFGV